MSEPQPVVFSDEEVLLHHANTGTRSFFTPRITAALAVAAMASVALAAGLRGTLTGSAGAHVHTKQGFVGDSGLAVGDGSGLISLQADRVCPLNPEDEDFFSADPVPGGTLYCYKVTWTNEDHCLHQLTFDIPRCICDEYGGFDREDGKVYNSDCQDVTEDFFVQKHSVCGILFQSNSGGSRACAQEAPSTYYYCYKVDGTPPICTDTDMRFVLQGATNQACEDVPGPCCGCPTPAPTEATPAPTEATPAPTEVTPAPTEATPAPTPVTPAPTPATPAPTEATPAPTEATPAPTEATPAPTEATPAPTAATPAPTPSGGTPVPTPTPAPTGPFECNIPCGDDGSGSMIVPVPANTLGASRGTPGNCGLYNFVSQFQHPEVYHDQVCIESLSAAEHGHDAHDHGRDASLGGSLSGWSGETCGSAWEELRKEHPTDSMPNGTIPCDKLLLVLYAKCSPLCYFCDFCK